MKRSFLIYFCLALHSCNFIANYQNSQSLKPAEYYFHIFGDSREGLAVYTNLARVLRNKANPDFVIHLGDIIANPGMSYQFAPFLEINSSYFPHIPFYPIIGNHDVGDIDSFNTISSVYPILKDKGYYVRQIKQCYCIFLNSVDYENETIGVNDEQVSWLRETLNNYNPSSGSYIAVMVHHPLFPQNHHINDPLPNNDELHEIFVESGVSLVLSGHEHSYSHQLKDGVHYVISGGAGSLIYKDASESSAFFHGIIAGYDNGSLNLSVVDRTGYIRDEVFIKFSN